MKRIWVMVGVLLFGLSSTGFAATYTVDGAHSDVGFSVRHLGVSKVRGQFTDVSGTVIWKGKKQLSEASFEGSATVKSINTNNEKRDVHLRSADFFDADQYPKITFKSTQIRKKGQQFEAYGNLTIHGVTKLVKLPITVLGPVKDPWGNEKLGVEGELTIDRRDFGLTWNKTLDQGGLLIGEKVTITLSIEAKKI